MSFDNAAFGGSVDGENFYEQNQDSTGEQISMATRETKSSVRKFGLSLVGDIPWGTHLCQFYQTKEDLIDILVPYFKAGLKNNEFCMWVTAEPLNEKYADEAMKKAMPNFSKYVENRQIEIISYKDWYLKGGVFDCDRVLKVWISKLEKALKKGYDGLRLTRNTFWLEKKDWPAFTEYEEAVNNVIGKYNMIAVCTYSLDKCNANEIIDVIRNHQFAIVKRSGMWELIESSERKKIAKDLLRTEQKFAALYNSMTEGVALHEVVYDVSGNAVDYVIIDVNPAFEKITGLSKKQSVGKRASELYGTGAPPYLNIYARVAKSGRPTSFETYFPPMQKHFGVSVFSPSKGKFNTIFYDITERKKAEDILGEQALIIASASDAIFSTEKSLIIKSWNKAAERIFGWTAQEVIGKASTSIFNAIYPTLDGKTREEALNQLFEKGFWKGEIIYHKKDGSPIPVSASVNLVKDKNGGALGTVAIVHDITSRKRREDALRESQRDLIRAQAVAKTGSWRLDTRLNILLWSDEAYHLFGLPKGTPLTYEIFLGKVHPEDVKYVDAKWNAALQGEPYDIEHRIMVNKEVKWMREKGELEFDKDMNLLGGFGTVQDITEQKRMQRQLEEYANQMEKLAEERAEKLKDAERLAAIGATAGMVGHDIRNPLQAIVGELYLAKGNLLSLSEGECKESLEETVATIEEQIGYINKIVTDLQDFAKPLLPCMEETNLQSLIQSALPIMDIPETVKVELFLNEQLPNFRSDAAYIKRVVSNLISNAIQAMPKGGKLTIRTCQENTSANLIIEDTGVGIPLEVRSKLFQPLFTTKSKGQGFGLAVCKRLVEAMNGTITFESEVDKGTKFIVKLPMDH